MDGLITVQSLIKQKRDAARQNRRYQESSN